MAEVEGSDLVWARNGTEDGMWRPRLIDACVYGIIDTGPSIAEEWAAKGVMGWVLGVPRAVTWDGGGISSETLAGHGINGIYVSPEEAKALGIE